MSLVSLLQLFFFLSYNIIMTIFSGTPVFIADQCVLFPQPSCAELIEIHFPWCTWPRPRLKAEFQPEYQTEEEGEDTDKTSPAVGVGVRQSVLSNPKKNCIITVRVHREWDGNIHRAAADVWIKKILLDATGQGRTALNWQGGNRSSNHQWRRHRTRQPWRQTSNRQ